MRRNSHPVGQPEPVGRDADVEIEPISPRRMRCSLWRSWLLSLSGEPRRRASGVLLVDRLLGTPMLRREGELNPAGRGSGIVAYPTRKLGTHDAMTVLIILVVLALIFGIGAVLEGLLWMFLIGLALVVAAIWFGWTRLRQT